MRRHQKESCVSLRDNGPPAKQFKFDSTPSTSASMQTCDCCNVTLTTAQMHSHKRSLQHKANACVPSMDGVSIIQSAFKYRIISYRVHSEHNHLDYVMFFNEIKHKILNLLEEALQIHTAIKVNLEVFAKYMIQSKELTDMKSFNTTNKILDQAMNLSDVLDSFVEEMITQTTEFQERDSGV